MAYSNTSAAAFRRVVPHELATQGESTGRVRAVLYASLGLAILAGVVLSLFFA